MNLALRLFTERATARLRDTAPVLVILGANRDFARRRNEFAEIGRALLYRVIAGVGHKGELPLLNLGWC